MHTHAMNKSLSRRRAERAADQAIWNATSQSGLRSDSSRHFENTGSGLVLDSREVARKLWHMTPGALILALPLLRHRPLIQYHLPALIAVFTGLLSILSFVHAKRFSRPGERDWSVSVCLAATRSFLDRVSRSPEPRDGRRNLAVGDGRRGVMARHARPDILERK